MTPSAQKIQFTLNSISSFPEIESWELGNTIKRFVPPSSKLTMTDNSGIIVVIESTPRGLNINLLDRIVLAVKSSEDFFYKVFGKKKKLSKKDIGNIADILMEQSKKLESMAATYRIMATALRASPDNLVEIVKSSDQRMFDMLENPFV